MTVEFAPFAERVVTKKGIPCDNIFALMKDGLPVSPTAPPKRIALSLAMGVIVCPKRACGLSPVKSTRSMNQVNIDGGDA